MSRSPIPRSDLLAVVNARQAVALNASVDAQQVTKLLRVIEILAAMNRRRCNHIGIVNSFLDDLLTSGVFPEDYSPLADGALELMSAGIQLAIDDSGIA